MDKLGKINNIMSVLLEYMNTHYKPIVFDKHCVNCFPQCPNSRVDLRKDKRVIEKYGVHVVNEGYIISATDIPELYCDDKGKSYIKQCYIVRGNNINADTIKADLIAKGLSVVVSVASFSCGAGSVVKVDFVIEY